MEIAGVIAIFEKGLLASIVTLGHMMRDAGENDAWKAGHGAMIDALPAEPISGFIAAVTVITVRSLPVRTDGMHVAGAMAMVAMPTAIEPLATSATHWTACVRTLLAGGFKERTSLHGAWERCCRHLSARAGMERHLLSNFGVITPVVAFSLSQQFRLSIFHRPPLASF
jgi:hypothetical protein